MKGKETMQCCDTEGKKKKSFPDEKKENLEREGGRVEQGGVTNLVEEKKNEKGGRLSWEL